MLLCEEIQMTDEKRKEIRASTEIRVEYRTVGSFLSDYVVNISRGGVFIHTECPLVIGSVVRLIFFLPGMPFLFDLSGEVKWIEEKSADGEGLSGMGIEFIGLDQRVKKRLEDYVKKLPDQIESKLEKGKIEPPKITMKTLTGSKDQVESLECRERYTQRGGTPLPSRRRKDSDVTKK
jgi:type IV pilus assembly protein PilZ